QLGPTGADGQGTEGVEPAHPRLGVLLPRDIRDRYGDRDSGGEGNGEPLRWQLLQLPFGCGREVGPRVRAGPRMRAVAVRSRCLRGHPARRPPASLTPTLDRLDL